MHLASLHLHSVGQKMASANLLYLGDLLCQRYASHVRCPTRPSELGAAAAIDRAMVILVIHQVRRVSFCTSA